MSKEPFAIDRPEDVSEDVWADFLRLRRAKKAPVTATAIRGFRREADRAGIDLERAIEFTCEMGWQGFRADWYERSKPKAAAAKTPWQKQTADRVAEFSGRKSADIIDAKGVTIYVAKRVG